jgi:PAS domain S-box-containing protein
MVGDPTVMKLADDLESTADGAFVVDEDLKMVFANQSAKRMLGFRLDGSTPKYCFQILRGRDDRQRLVCLKHCPVARELLSGSRVRSFDLQVPTDAKGNLWLNMSVFRYSEAGSGNSYIVHLFRDITHKKRDARFVERLIEAASNYHKIQPTTINPRESTRKHPRLTQREREVLKYLAMGHSTREIAQQLSISVNTVRNHVQRVLQKLNARSRLEAVIYAIDNDLVD